MAGPKVSFIRRFHCILYIMHTQCLHGASSAPKRLARGPRLPALHTYYVDYTVYPFCSTVRVFSGQLHNVRRQQASRRTRIITNIFRTLSVTGGYISCFLPSVKLVWHVAIIILAPLCIVIFHLKAIALYWTISSSSALVQNLIVMFPKSRRALNIPKVPSEKERPFRHMLETIYLKTKAFLELQRRNRP